MTDINEWKNNYNFEEGVRLAIKYKASSTLMVLLKSESSYSRKKLTQFLNEVNERLIKSAEKKSVSIKHNQQLLHPSDDKKLPIHLQKKVAEKNKMYLEAAHLHSQLEVIPEEARYLHASKILKLQKKITGIWNELDYYRENGQELSAKDDLNNKSIKELFVLKERYTNYIYRNRANGKKHLLQKYQDLLDSLNKILDAKTI